MQFLIKNAVTIILCIILIIGGWFIYDFIVKAPPIITSPDSYMSIMLEHTETDNRYLFLPTIIPFGTEKKAFYYQPSSFSRKKDLLILRLKLPEKKFKEEIKDLLSSGRKLNKNNDHSGFKKVFPSFILPIDIDSYSLGNLPNDFQVFLYKSRPWSESRKPAEGFLAFTAFSRHRREILYCVQKW